MTTTVYGHTYGAAYLVRKTDENVSNKNCIKMCSAAKRSNKVSQTSLEQIKKESKLKIFKPGSYSRTVLQCSITE